MSEAQVLLKPAELPKVKYPTGKLNYAGKASQGQIL